MALFDPINQGKLIKTSVFKKIFHPVRLGWEDLLAIESIFKENFKDYTIEADGVGYDSSEELLADLSRRRLNYFMQPKKLVRKLAFRTGEPYYFKVEMLKQITIFDSKINEIETVETTVEIQKKLQDRLLSIMKMLQRRKLERKTCIKLAFKIVFPLFILLMLFVNLVLTKNHIKFNPVFTAFLILFIIIYLLSRTDYDKPVLTIKDEWFEQQVHA
jgi:hypothetical protein